VIQGLTDEYIKVILSTIEITLLTGIYEDDGFFVSHASDLDHCSLR
jgi:hypothetical protein